MTTRAVLFDFDGVLADTENVHVAAWERVFGIMGWEVPPEECARAAEVDDRQFLAGIFTQRGLQGGDVAGWVQRKQQLARGMLSDQPRVCLGVVELIERLRDQVRLAVVSTSWRENIEVVLDASGLRDAFDVIIGKEDVQSVKPDPEGYQRALRQLGLEPAKAWAVEDSAPGLRAARAAGLRCLVVGRRSLPADLIGQFSIRLVDLRDTNKVLQALDVDASPA